MQHLKPTYLLISRVSIYHSTINVAINHWSPFVFSLYKDARPTESEKEVYILAESVLFDAADILADLQTYKGASAEIRQVCLCWDSLNRLQHLHALIIICWYNWHKLTITFVQSLKCLLDISIPLQCVFNRHIDDLSVGDRQHPANLCPIYRTANI